jgi:hypothetical protein
LPQQQQGVNTTRTGRLVLSGLYEQHHKGATHMHGGEHDDNDDDRDDRDDDDDGDGDDHFES